jgi:hypothetical protein
VYILQGEGNLKEHSTTADDQGARDDDAPSAKIPYLFLRDRSRDERATWYRRMKHLRALWRGLRADAARCTACGSPHMRISQKGTDSLTRLLGLRLYRCETCFERFALPHRREG